MLSIEETKALSAIDPEYGMYRQLAQILQGWTMKTDVQQLRRGYTQLRLLQHTVKPDPSTLPYTEDDIQIPVRDGAFIVVRVHKPRGVPMDGCPGFVVFHGGGFFVGDLEMAGPLCRAFTSLGGIAVNVGYRLAPENPFPIPVHDAYDALKWTAQNIDRLGINPAKGFLVGGECAGADIALAIAHLYRDDKIVPPLTGIYSELTSAVTPETVPEKYKDHFISLEQNARAPYFMAESIEFVKSQYKPDPQSPLAYAILHPNHRGLPRTYFQACGMDPVRDCTLIMEQVWRDAGIETRLDIYPGLPHAAWTKWTSAGFSKKHSEDTKAGLAWLLEA